MRPYSDPNIHFLAWLMVVIPMLYTATTYALTWSVIFSYAKGYTIILVILTILLSGACFKFFKSGENQAKIEAERDRERMATELDMNRILPLLHKQSEGQSNTVHENEDEDMANSDNNEPTSTFRDLEKYEINLKCILTSIFTPCIIIHHTSNRLLTSSLTTVFSLVVWLQLLPFLAKLNPITMDSHPPIIHCFDSEVNLTFTNVCLWNGTMVTSTCDLNYIRLCSGNCLPSIRMCGYNEDSEYVLEKIVSPALSVMLFISLLCSGFLQKLGDYRTLYKVTCKKVIHKTLLMSMVEDGLHDELKEVLKRSKYRNMAAQDLHGNTILHAACARGLSEIVETIIEAFGGEYYDCHT